MRARFADDPDVTPYELDLADTDAIRETTRRVRDEHGPVHYLVNNAAVNHGASVDELDPDDLSYSMQVNAVAPVVLMQAFLGDMDDAGFGRIVNVTSGASFNCPPGAGAYSASKAALNVLTVTAANERADTDVKINLASPGPVRTEMAPDAPLDPSACHRTFEYLLTLDADGPTGRLFWLGYEIPLFPDHGDMEWEAGMGSDELTQVLDGAPHRGATDE
jgi:NAD(P)-dependent dehydrogenase (short-subunit alcohol dehydrogenase family)